MAFIPTNGQQVRYTTTKYLKKSVFNQKNIKLKLKFYEFFRILITQLNIAIFVAFF